MQITTTYSEPAELENLIIKSAVDKHWVVITNKPQTQAWDVTLTGDLSRVQPQLSWVGFGA